MNENEKLLEWLKFTNCIGNGDPICEKCPFVYEYPCFHAVEKALLKILTPNEAQLLSKREVSYYLGARDSLIPPVYIEYRNEKNNKYELASRLLWDNDLDNYMQTWRVWNVHPTDEQRLEEKWEDE